jgi:hypothetical protein
LCVIEVEIKLIKSENHIEFAGFERERENAGEKQDKQEQRAKKEITKEF